MRQLAPEILGEVFWWCIDSDIDVSDDLGGISPKNAPLLLLRVCQWWRHVTFGTPRLWTILALQFTEDVDPHIIIPMWLRHSASLPISVYFNPDNWNFLDDRGPDRLCHALEAARLIIPHFPRYKTFHASGSQRLFQGLLPPDSHTDAPLLADLRFSLEKHFQPPEIQGTIYAPRLRHFEGWDIRSSLNLNHRHLRVLHLNLSGQSSLASLVPFLQSCASLEVCKLIRPCRDDTLLGKCHILLPRLMLLDLTWEQRAHLQVSQFLNVINTPALESLSLNEVGRLGERWFTPSLQSLLSPLPSRLKHLHLVGLQIQPDAMLPFLDMLPSLESLHVIGIALQTYFFDALTNEPMALLARCPKLSWLDLESSQVQLGLVRMIESRVPSAPGMLTSDACNLTRISLGNCTGMSRTGLEVLARLVQDNPDVRIDGLDNIRRMLDEEDLGVCETPHLLLIKFW